MSKQPRVGKKAMMALAFGLAALAISHIAPRSGIPRGAHCMCCGPSCRKKYGEFSDKEPDLCHCPCHIDYKEPKP